MAFVFNPFTGNFDIADTVTFDPPAVNLDPYELKTDSEARDADLQDQIDELEKQALSDAPSDGNTYSRKDAGWVSITLFVDAPEDGKQYVRKDGNWEEVTVGSGDVEEAPIDGTPYARQDGGWVEVGSGTFVEPPDDGEVYGRKTEGGVSTWEEITAVEGGGNTVWTANPGEDSPTVDDGVQINDLLYRPAKDQLFIWRVFDVTGEPTWMQVLANPGGGGGTPGEGAIEPLTVNEPLTKTGPLTDPVLGIDLSDYAAKTDIPENTSDLTNDSGFITLADVPESGEALTYRLETDKTLRTTPQIQLVDSDDNFTNVTFEGSDGIECTSNAAGIVVSASALQTRVADLEAEVATLKSQMAKILQAGDKIVGAMTTPDTDDEDSSLAGDIEIQL